METKYFKSVKTNAVAELVGQNEHGVILLLEDGEERILATSTFKRWWKAVEQPKPQAKQRKTRATTQSITTSPTVVTDSLEGIHKEFIVSAHKLAEAVNSELFVRPNTKSYNLRKDNTIYLFFQLTKKGVTLYAKTKAIGEGFTYTKVNHNFDAKILFDSWNTETYNQLRRIHDLSLQYQASRKTKK